jgi:hypothetical protein
VVEIGQLIMEFCSFVDQGWHLANIKQHHPGDSDLEMRSSRSSKAGLEIDRAMESGCNATKPCVVGKRYDSYNHTEYSLRWLGTKGPKKG